MVPTTTAPAAIGLGGFIAASDLAACLLPLLRALGWRGNPRHVAEALPHFANELDLTGLRNVMAGLNYSSRPEPARLDRLDARLLPCLFLPDDGAALVVLGAAEHGGLRVFDGGMGCACVLADTARAGTAYFFHPLELEGQAQPRRGGWFVTVAGRFRPLFWQAFTVTFMINVLALAAPMFVKAVYDQVIGSGSPAMLGWLLGGVGIALGADLMLRRIRARILAYVGARLDILIGNAIFQRILSLPISYTERATIGAQVARIKDFESVREFFTGPMAQVFLEMPFVLFYIGVIAVMGGPVVALVPFVMVGLFAVVALVMDPLVRKSVAEASRAGTRRQEFVVETVSKMRALKFCGAEQVWMERYRDISAKAAMANFRTSHLTNMVSTISQGLVSAAGLATMGVGVLEVLAGNMTVGGLIAAMMLVWRVLSPLQMGFMAIARVEQVRGSIRQIDNLMTLKPERDPAAMAAPLKNLKGRVAFSRVSLRYSNETDPALVGVSFEVEPGEVVAVVGRNGSGKSTVLKVLMGLYAPQAGSVRLDNIDIRQMDPAELRHAIGYVPQVCHLFHGSIAQNLRLAQPTATDAELYAACDQADVLSEIAALPKKFDTRIGDGRSDQLPASFVQKISLARAYLKRSAIMVFDEPVNGLDFEGDHRFMDMISRLRGHSTIFVVTHRPSHLKMADRILVFDSGYLRMAGPASEVLSRIPGDLL